MGLENLRVILQPDVTAVGTEKLRTILKPVGQSSISSSGMLCDASRVAPTSSSIAACRSFMKICNSSTDLTITSEKQLGRLLYQKTR